MKKLLVTLAAALLAVSTGSGDASAASCQRYVVSHRFVAVKPALSNSPCWRSLAAPVATSGSPTADGLVEYGSAFTAPVLSGTASPIVSSGSAGRHSHRYVFMKPGNRHQWSQ